MREQIVVHKVTMQSEIFDEYEILFVKPAAATVDLCSFTAFPKEMMYLTTRAYKGIYDPNPRSAMGSPPYLIENALEDIQKTKLQTPLEMVHTLWLLRDVTRAFTHQLVRYRVGTAFVQESMRFFGMRKTFKVLITGEAGKNNSWKDYDDKITNLDAYVIGAMESIQSYVTLLSRGVPDQDARGVLPTNILTNIYFDCSFRTLQNIFPQRLCCQAQQGEWQPILRDMRRIIKEKMGEEMESLLRAPYERGEDCGYRASFDRPCIWRDKESTT